MIGGAKRSICKDRYVVYYLYSSLIRLIVKKQIHSGTFLYGTAAVKANRSVLDAHLHGSMPGSYKTKRQITIDDELLSRSHPAIWLEEWA